MMARCLELAGAQQSSCPFPLRDNLMASLAPLSASHPGDRTGCAGEALFPLLASCNSSLYGTNGSRSRSSKGFSARRVKLETVRFKESGGVRAGDSHDRRSRLPGWTQQQLMAPAVPTSRGLRETQSGARTVLSVPTNSSSSHLGKVGTISMFGNSEVASFGAATWHADERLMQKSSWRRPRSQEPKPLSAMMPHIVVATAIAALTCPQTFTWFEKQYYPYALGGIMLSIGVQLSLDDFATVFKQPSPVVLGLLLQYIIKPALGLAVVSFFRVPPQFTAGLLLTACVAGAQLASYAANLAKGSVALSVVLTSLSTFASVAATPALSKLLIGSVVPVDPVCMAKSILQVVIVPVCLGLFLNAKAKPAVDAARPYLPLLAMLCTALCIGSPLANNRCTLLSLHGLALLLPVLAFHALSFTSGYFLAKLPGLEQSEETARTLSLSGGMQSSTLAMLLASQFLGSSQAVPPSCSVVVMSLMGLSLGSFWGRGRRLRDLASDALTTIQYGSMPLPRAAPSLLH